MQKEMKQEAAGYPVKNRRQTWKKIVGALACVVVFCTIYALVHPAITMQGTEYCGIEEHKHGSECYEKKLICGLEEATEDTTEVHTHSEDCYVRQQELICGLEEDTTVHTHTESCISSEKKLICENEDPEHQHTEECYETIESYICGLEEGAPVGHIHTDECYAVKEELQCGLEEGAAVPGHTHTDECYEMVLVCEKEEHEHVLSCYSNPEADTETTADWEQSVSGATLTGDWRNDLIAVAKSQLGYTESILNYMVDENDTKMGYTRYGAWYGDPYGTWDAMFLSFCVNYAGIEGFPLEASCSRWTEALQQEESNFYHIKGDYVPQVGDLVFFDMDSDQITDHVGLTAELIEATETEPARLRTIEGDADNCVRYVDYEQNDARIMGFAELPEKVQEQEAVSYQCCEDGLEVTASFIPDENLPENTSLVVQKLSPEDMEGAYDEKYQEMEQEIVQESEEEIVYFNMYKVYLEADGQEIVPENEADVEVKIVGDQYPVMPRTELLHFAEDGTEMIAPDMDESGNLNGSFNTKLSAEYAVVGAKNSNTYSLLAETTQEDKLPGISNHKTIDAFRGNMDPQNLQDNPDTNLDNQDIEQTDLYRLYLDAKVEADQKPIDMLIVVDQSGSMENSDMEISPRKTIRRDEAVRLVLNGTYNEYDYETKKQDGLIYQFLEMNPENQVAVVEFHGKAYTAGVLTDYKYNDDADVLLGWQSTADYVNTKGQYYNGTNYCAGLYAADDILDDPKVQNDHKKVMVFLSDGLPTLYLQKDAQVKDKYWKGGNSTQDSGDNLTLCSNAAKTVLGELKLHHSDLSVYTIGIAGNMSDPKNAGVLAEMGQFHGVKDTNDLTDALRELIFDTSYTKLSINDTLSSYVDVYEKQPDFKVTMKSKEGQPIVLYENGAVTDEGIGKLNRIEHTPGTKGVSAVFEDTYKLEAGYTYTLSFNIKTTETAYEHHATNPYPHTGEDGTDYGNNKTSSNQPGYHSNADNGATMKYWVDETEHTEPYKHPVVQVTDRELKVVKRWFCQGTEVTNTKNGKVTFKLWRSAYKKPPVVTPAKAYVNLDYKRPYRYVSIGNHTENMVVNREVEVGSAAVLTFDMNKDEFTGLEVNNKSIQLEGVQKEGSIYTYTYAFTVSGNTRVVIKSNNAWSDPPTYTLECPPVEQDNTPILVEKKLYGEGTYELTDKSENPWEMVFKNLPEKGELSGEEVYYTYTVVEDAVPLYTTDYDNNDGITEGTITINNRTDKKPGHELPATGGSGTHSYTMGGLLLIAAGMLLLYINKKRRKEEMVSS